MHACRCRMRRPDRVALLAKPRHPLCGVRLWCQEAQDRSAEALTGGACRWQALCLTGVWDLIGQTDR